MEKGGYKLHKWYTSKPNKDTDNFGNSYETGFHIFLTREAAREYRKRFNWRTSYSSFKVKKVKFKCVISTGMQCAEGQQFSCVVAEKMLIMREKV